MKEILKVISGGLAVLLIYAIFFDQKTTYKKTESSISQASVSEPEKVTAQLVVPPFQVVGDDGGTVSVLVAKTISNDELKNLLISVSCAHQTGNQANIGIPPAFNGGLVFLVFDNPKVADIKSIKEWLNPNISDNKRATLQKKYIENTRAEYIGNRKNMPKDLGSAHIGIEGDLTTPTPKNYEEIALKPATQCPTLIVDEAHKPQVAQAVKRAKAEEEAYAAYLKKYGNPPVRSGWDGTYSSVKWYLQKVLNDPDSLKMDSCGEVFRGKTGWSVHCDYRGRNSFGGMVKQGSWFTINNGEVVSMQNE